MNKLLPIALSLCLSAPPLLADNKREKERLENCGTVIQEIMDIPDNIPQDLIDKADCVIIYPSVVKAAFIFGGSYGRGAMTCRTGEKFTGPWSAPTMMALEGGSFGFQIGGQATDFVLLVMNGRGAHAILKSKARSRRFGGCRSQGAHSGGFDRRYHACRDPLLLEGARPVCRNLARGFDRATRQRSE